MQADTVVPSGCHTIPDDQVDICVQNISQIDMGCTGNGICIKENGRGVVVYVDNPMRVWEYGHGGQCGLKADDGLLPTQTQGRYNGDSYCKTFVHPDSKVIAIVQGWAGWIRCSCYDPTTEWFYCAGDCWCQHEINRIWCYIPDSDPPDIQVDKIYTSGNRKVTFYGTITDRSGIDVTQSKFTGESSEDMKCCSGNCEEYPGNINFSITKDIKGLLNNQNYSLEIKATDNAASSSNYNLCSLVYDGSETFQCIPINPPSDIAVETIEFKKVPYELKELQVRVDYDENVVEMAGAAAGDQYPHARVHLYKRNSDGTWGEYPFQEDINMDENGEYYIITDISAEEFNNSQFTAIYKAANCKVAP